ncbi:beta-1,4-glucuronyltransferase 1 [Aplysia californica]|uniref:Beta-1,4-glucuronyltransferase 1 n=1 Tax=Aplysia californica TaxID=6500 RepID=A0ABM1VWX5_APLCA|nr:beta-1,4-glucuronyltransferase 1 [Aplysia californica]
MLRKYITLWKRSPFEKCRFWPLLTTLVLLIILLQVWHMALLSRLEAKDAQREDSRSLVGRQLQGRMFRTVLEEMEERVTNSYRFDRSGTYHVLDNFLTSEHVVRGRNLYDVSVVTQCSSNHLHHLSDLAQRWNGPISVSVFTFDDDFVHTVSSMLHFHFCNDHIYRHVSFHLVYPISRAPKHLEGLRDLKLSCADHDPSSSSSVDLSPAQLGAGPSVANYASEDLEYPNNLLRNLAINYAQTPYIFMIDVDMVPSENLRQEFQKLMSSHIQHPHFPVATTKNNSSSSSGADAAVANPLSAFVVPAFEIQEKVPIPNTKSELLTLWLKTQVRPFYWEACNPCQKLTDYDKWRRLGKGGPLAVAYSVERNALWEPFYIAKTSVPLYDERFKQYGFNRVSQVCEMHVAGFTFHILDNAFLVHKGFKTPGSFHAQKDAENKRNKVLYRKFVEELRVKYPDTQRRCFDGGDKKSYFYSN